MMRKGDRLALVLLAKPLGSQMVGMTPLGVSKPPYLHRYMRSASGFPGSWTIMEVFVKGGILSWACSLRQASHISWQL